MKTPIQHSLKQSLKRAGGVAALAAFFRISPVSVREWIKRGLVPAERCPEIEKFSGGAVICESLNAQVDWTYIRNTGRTVALPPQQTEPPPAPPMS